VASTIRSSGRLLVLFRVACALILLAPGISESQRLVVRHYSKAGFVENDTPRSIDIDSIRGEQELRVARYASRSADPSATRMADTTHSIMLYARIGAAVGAIAGYVIYRISDHGTCEDNLVWSPACGALPWVAFGGAIGFGFGAWVGHIRIPKR
jgi:hypothetical protein